MSNERKELEARFDRLAEFCEKQSKMWFLSHY